jgi:2-polyprenyl-6-methoxyphenol hydroxylase-like FAD-dependent oxidoreductase
MSSLEYDIITVGGGLRGSAFAKAMAEQGKRVLILERETEFKDRVRGEFMTPWGVARLLCSGFTNLFVTHAASMHRLRIWALVRVIFQNYTTTTSCTRLFSSEMQEVVLNAAKSAGAEARRGATVLDVEPGPQPKVTFQDSGATKTASATLVVAADGRNSAARKWVGVRSCNEKPQPLYFAGLLMQGVSIPQDHSFLLFLPPLGQATAMTPAGRGRFRTYVAYQDHEGLRLQGDESVKSFIAEATKAELVADCFCDAEAIGPLASFPLWRFLG